jgi:hypothetical protein
MELALRIALGCVSVGLLACLLAAIVEWHFNRLFKQPSNISDLDVEQVQRSFDKAIIETARRRREMLSAVSSN